MESRNEVKKIWMPTITSVAARIASLASASAPNPPLAPPREDDHGEHEADEHHDRSGEQPVLEAHSRPQALEPRIALAEDVDAVCPRGKPEGR